MKTSRYTEAQIMAILRQAEGGVPVAKEVVAEFWASC
jgi:putative transposase